MKKLLLSGLMTLCSLSCAYTQQIVNCYTVNSNLSTGSVSKVLFSYPVTDDELIVGNPFQSRAWAKFNISGVPDNAIIIKVDTWLYVFQATSTPASHELVSNSLYVDPVTASGNTLWNSIDDPPSYNVSLGWGDATGRTGVSNYTTMLIDIQSSLTKNWFAVGFYEQNEDAGACYINGHLTAAKEPYLTIYFNLPAPANVVASDGTYCDKVRISWNAVTNADRYCIFKGATLLGYTSNLYFDYAGASTSPEEYRVFAAKSSIDNRFSSLYGSNSGYKKSKPNQPGQISGSNSVCQGSSQTYSISPVSGATSYTWTLPSGWSGSSTTTSINATAGSSGGSISVIANNDCGSSVHQMLSITVNVIPNKPNLATYGYSCFAYGVTPPYLGTKNVSPVSGATSYSWTLPSGWSGSSSSNTITIDFGALPSSGTIYVTANNSCGSSTPSAMNLDVDISPQNPGVITGLTTVCQGSSNTYSISSVSGATSYNWTLPSGWSGSSSSTSIEAIVGASGGTIEVYAKSKFCRSLISELDISIASKPSVTTSSVSTLSSSTATGGGNITSDGGAEVTASGLCWSTSPDPTISDLKTTDGEPTGSFTSMITGLSENVTYYIRAYATNCSGTSYGSNVEYNNSNSVDVILSSEISVYPNPVSGILNIEYRNSTYETINIINQQGVLLLTERIVSSQQQLDFSEYEYGLYILEFVKHGGGIKRVKVVHK